MNSQRSTVIGVFHERQEAQRAVDESRRRLLAFADAHLGRRALARRGLAQLGSPGSRCERRTRSDRTGSRVLEPVRDSARSVEPRPASAWECCRRLAPVLRGGGLFAANLVKAVGGGAVGGIVGALIGLGIPEEDAHYYEGEFKKGKTLVTVHAADRASEAWAILTRHGAYDRSVSTHTTRDVAVGREEVIGEHTASGSSTSSDVRKM